MPNGTATIIDHMSIFDAALDVLGLAAPEQKSQRARQTAADWRSGRLTLAAPFKSVPDQPARPARPVLAPPGDMPRRRLGSEAGRLALMHAVAHIEFNAIDLAYDMIARFGPVLPVDYQHEFVSDWLSVGDDEGRHFQMVVRRLDEMGGCYGDLPAHNGLWEAAAGTADDVLARLAIAPMVLEARGLDVTPQMIQNLTKAGDETSAGVLQVIYDEEIGHVATGVKWLTILCADAGYQPEERFRHFVKTRFAGLLKEPFNHDARQRAGLEKKFYLNITH